MRSLAAVLAFALAASSSCSRPEPAPSALPEPAPSALPEPAPSAAPRAPAPPDEATPSLDLGASFLAPAQEAEPDVDPDTVAVPPLDPEAKAAVAAFVAVQRTLAGERAVVRDGRDLYDVQVSSRARARLPTLKRASREAARRVIGAGLAAGTRAPKVLSIQVRKALHEAGAVLGERWSTGSTQEVGALEEVVVRRPEGHPGRLGVVVWLSLPCSSDDSLYVLEEQRSGVPKVVMAVEANGYTSIRGGQAGIAYRLSPPDAQGGWFAVVANATPWCSSVWTTMPFRVLAPGASPEATQVLLKGEDSAWAGTSSFVALGAGRDEVTLRYSGATRFTGQPWGPHVRRYVRRGARFERAQPIVDEPVDLPGEWLRMPWEEAQRFVAGADPGALRAWHERLRRAESACPGGSSVAIADTAGGRTRLLLTSTDCKALPPRLHIDVHRDGEGWAMGAIGEPR